MFDESPFFSRSEAITILVLVLGVVIPMCFHLYLHWITRRKDYRKQQGLNEAAITKWLDEARKNYLSEAFPLSDKERREKRTL